MDLTHINAEAWKTLEEKYPAAYHHLLRASLEGEARVLIREMANTRDIRRANWITARLEELENAGII